MGKDKLHPFFERYLTNLEKLLCKKIEFCITSAKEGKEVRADNCTFLENCRKGELEILNELDNALMGYMYFLLNRSKKETT